MFRRLREFTVEICNASEMEDDVLHQVRKRAFFDYYEEQTKRGFWHPVLTEAMADYADDRPTAIRFYRLALEQSKQMEAPTYTALIDLARELLEAGRIEEAEACLRDGRAEALAENDSWWVENADRVLSEMPQTLH